MTGQKRLASKANSNAMNKLYRGQSFGGSASKRVAKQVMAIGLAPEVNDKDVEDDSEM